MSLSTPRERARMFPVPIHVGRCSRHLGERPERRRTEGRKAAQGKVQGGSRSTVCLSVPRFTICPPCHCHIPVLAHSHCPACLPAHGQVASSPCLVPEQVLSALLSVSMSTMPYRHCPPSIWMSATQGVVVGSELLPVCSPRGQVGRESPPQVLSPCCPPT